MYRWIGFNREGNVLNLTLNNQQFTHKVNGVRVQPERWHNLICSVDLAKKKIQTFFDGHELEVINLPLEFHLDVIGSPYVDRDRKFTFANYAKGSVYRGFAANLKVFDHALTADEIALLDPGKFSSQAQRSMPILLLMAAVLAIGLVLFFLVWRHLKLHSRQEAVLSK